MAKNTGCDYRVGSVKDRVQTYNPRTKTWVKIDTNTNLFIGQKADGTKFKGVAEVVDGRRN